ncbi:MULTISPECIES: maleylpyruvate isomerase family mycothiol-dependent enzyme [unclassified Streptomyces]|uniref:maleylpyruvate isomerase family mycothiol-dependent enzyme n=1 Tax=unclassified Streptomyces TaxID=2593676 RepID=UPI0036481B7D
MSLSDTDHPSSFLPALTVSTDHMLRTVSLLTAEQIREPSLLPGWTRAHVLVHLARGADSRLRLLTAARGGPDLPQYTDEATRAHEIEQGARRDAEAIRVDLGTSLDALLRGIEEHPDEAWDTPVRWLGGSLRPVRGVLWSLLRELEVHHVDLAATYTPADWPTVFAIRELRETVRELSDGPAMPPMRISADEDPSEHGIGAGPGPRVQGTAADLLAWLTGRSDGTALTIDPPGALPRVPPWRQ